jgi:exopolysaccharide biosynthesis polyprenyl glycosylphosphotransferase
MARDPALHAGTNHAGTTTLGPALASAVPGPASRQYRALAVAVAGTDAVVVLSSFLGAFALTRGYVSPMQAVFSTVAVPAYLAAFGMAHLYDFRTLWPAEELKRILMVTAALVGLAAIGAFWTRAAIPRAWPLLSAAFVVLGILVTRRIWHFVLFRGRLRGRFLSRALLVGPSSQTGGLVRWMRSPEEGFLPVGIVQTDGQGGAVDGIPVVGDIDSVAEGIRRTRAEALFIPSNAVPPASMPGLLRTARLEGVALWVVPNLQDILVSRIAARAFGSVVALGVRPVRLSGWQAFVKRCIDIVGASVLLAVLAPVAALVAVAVRLESPGPVLFRQLRDTRGGRPFIMYKFRTMSADADAILARQGIDPTSPFFKLDRDPRLTRVGRFLRRTSLDEIPQLVNVLKGDMSLVGPRPLPMDQVRRNAAALETRHEVRAGLTGWWQIRGRSTVDPNDALRMDAFYIENWSPALDLYILLKTLGTVTRGTGAK